MLYLNRNIRYRSEKESIIVCDCKNLLDFELPLVYEPLLSALQNGYDELQPAGFPDEKALLNDLIEMEIISYNEARVSNQNANIWSALSYTENEFYG